MDMSFFDKTNFRDRLYAIVFSSFFFVCPFFRGLYFDREALWAQLFMALLVLSYTLCSIMRKKDFSVGSLLVVPVFLMVFAYMVPVLSGRAIHMQDAFLSVFRLMAAAVVFLTASQLFQKEENRRIFIIFVTASGVCCSLLVLDSAFGNVLNETLGLQQTGSDGYRIFGPMQYANTTAAFLCTVIFLLTAVFLERDKRTERALISSVMLPLFLALLLTMSRGAVLIFLFCVVLLCMLERRRTEFIPLLLPPVLLSVISIKKVYGAMVFYYQRDSGNALGGFFSVLILTALCGFLSAVMDRMRVGKRKSGFARNNKKVWRGIFLFSLILLLFAAAGYVLPGNVAARFSLSSLMQGENGRWAMYQDAMRMAGDYMWTGAGGGAFACLYRFYQRTLYTSKEVHSFYLQVLLESGILGFASLGGMLLLLLKEGKRALNEGACMLPVFISALYMALHSGVDFDFSFLFPLLLFFALLGMLDAWGEKRLKAGYALNSLTLLFSLLLIFADVFFLTA